MARMEPKDAGGEKPGTEKNAGPGGGPPAPEGAGPEHAALEMAGRGDLRGALKLLNDMRDRGQMARWDVIIAKARACERAGDLARALQYAYKTVDSEQVDTPFPLIAGLLYRLGRTGDLAKCCRIWEDYDHKQQHLFLNQARLMRMRGDTAGARAHTAAILELEGAFPEAHELRGDLLADAGDRRGAVIQYTKALGLDPTLVYAHIKRAEMLMEMGRFGDAALACWRGLKARPRSGRLREILRAARSASTN